MGARAIKEMEAGGIVKVAGMEWIILDHMDGGGTLCLMKDILEERVFDDEVDVCCDNWANSTLREYLNSELISTVVQGDVALISAVIDLTSDDGMTDYGQTEDYIFLLSADQYRKYRKHIVNADAWWWLVTPWSCNSATSCNVRGVSAGGALTNHDASSGNHGVRPALIFDESVIADDDNPAERSEAEIKMHDAFKEVEQKATKETWHNQTLKKVIHTWKSYILHRIRRIQNGSN